MTEVLESPIANISMRDVPGWRREPSTMLWELGKKVGSVEVDHKEERVVLAPEVEELRTKIPEGPNLFAGRLANVESVTFSGDRILIKTSETDFFSYLASAYYYREHEGDNPIRPLAVQATLLTPENEIIAEKRGAGAADFPEKLSFFSAALKPEQTDTTEAMKAILNKKLGLESLQLEPTGINRENVNNIYCIFYLARLREGKAEEMLKRLYPEKKARKKIFYKVSADETLGYIERLLEHRDIRHWNPAGYDSLVYALASANLRTPSQIKDLLQKTKHVFKEKPFEYTYPLEDYIRAL